MQTSTQLGCVHTWDDEVLRPQGLQRRRGVYMHVSDILYIGDAITTGHLQARKRKGHALVCRGVATGGALGAKNQESRQSQGDWASPHQGQPHQSRANSTTVPGQMQALPTIVSTPHSLLPLFHRVAHVHSMRPFRAPAPVGFCAHVDTCMQLSHLRRHV